MSTFTLYRFYAAGNELLYVGLSVNPGKRFEKHRGEKPWWCDVARIEMEQHPDLETLRQAERDAIKKEKPLHNIRMNGVGSSHASITAPQSPSIDGLVGRSFHSWRAARDDDSPYVTKRGERVLEWQGRILEQIDESLYLVETYSWMDGSPYETTLIQLSDMGMWTFYSSNIEMIAALGCREIRGRVDNRECGNPAEYITANFGLGSSAVCDHCAGYYNSVHAIIWKDGVASLGPETTVPHPMSPEAPRRR